MSRIKLSLMRPSNTFQVSLVAPCKNVLRVMELGHGARILMWESVAKAKGPQQITKCYKSRVVMTRVISWSGIGQYTLLRFE